MFGTASRRPLELGKSAAVGIDSRARHRSLICVLSLCVAVAAADQVRLSAPSHPAPSSYVGAKRPLPSLCSVWTGISIVWVDHAPPVFWTGSIGAASDAMLRCLRRQCAHPGHQLGHVV